MTDNKKYICLLFVLFACCSCSKQKKMLFRELKADYTGITFSNEVQQTDSFNVLTYPYIYNGAGVAAADFNNDGLEDLFFSANEKGKNKLYFNKGNFHFEDVTVKAGVQGKSDWCNGVTVVDINGDGWMDIYISTVTLPGFLKSANELYINNRNGTFTENAAAYGLNYSCHTTQAAFFDYDGDGDLDCFLLNHAATYLEAYQDVSARAKPDSVSGSKLLQNNNGKFIDVTANSGIYSSSLGYGLGISVGDLNNDGWPDIYVSNDFKENDYCYINNGPSPSPSGEGRGEVTFTESSAKLFSYTSRFSMGNDMADYNNDGWPDIISVDMLPNDEKILKATGTDDDRQTYDYKQHFGFYYQLAKNCLQQNVDGKFFCEVGMQKGVAATDWSWAPLFADFNNDGKKDLFISNGYKYRLNDQDFSIFLQNQLNEQQKQNIKVAKLPLTKYIPAADVPDFLFLNNGDAGFNDVSGAAGFTSPDFSNGAVYADLDNDGDLDLVINHMDGPAGIYKNEMPVKNYINIRLKGSNENTIAVGAKAFIYTGSNFQLYHQSPVRGFMSSVSPIIHAGLNDFTKADSITIIWPDGKGQKLKDIKSQQTITISYTDAVAGIAPPPLKKKIDTGWKNVTDSTGINFTHKEDLFDDLNVQSFLPHSIAAQGPEMAVADVNGDGLEDVLVCGAKNQAVQLFIQTQQSVFKYSPQPAFISDSAYESTDALFFDADNDNDPDLYIASGGNELFGRQELLKDRLYINDGKGNFTKSVSPDLFENKSCVRACDFDKDGDMDLFVGGRANARMYGYIPASVILKNDGKGNFSEVTEAISNGLINAGMITDAYWLDVDSDGWTDLITVGEWMPVTIFKNKKGKLVKEIQPGLQNSSGWWTCMFATDVDKDGDTDFLLGNWGANTKLAATEEHPLKMFVADWDKNGEIDPILSVYKKNNYYTFLTKLDLERRLPYLKKQFFKFTDMAGKTVEEVFGEDNLKKAMLLQAATLQSSLLLNNGGKFELKPLPSFLQAAPVFSFCSFIKEGKIKYMAGGNFYHILPYEGRYDALLPTVFSMGQNNNVEFENYINDRGCVKNIKTIQLANGKNVLLIAKNNERLSIISVKQ